jgi:hypothetical protein
MLAIYLAILLDAWACALVGVKLTRPGYRGGSFWGARIPALQIANDIDIYRIAIYIAIYIAI